jgi:pentatricopeptide repeat protein
MKFWRRNLSLPTSCLYFDFFLLYLILVLSLVFYSVSIGFEYVNLDDTLLVKYRLPYIFNPANIINSFKSNVMYLSDSTAFYYRPVLTISFILDALIFKDNFWGYHLTNILLHLVSVVLFYRLMLRLRLEKYVCFFLTLVFALHPVLMQTIVWVPGRNDSLLFIFLISALFYFLNYLESSSLKDFIFFVFFTFLAVFVKETAIMFLPVLFLFIFLVRRDKKAFKRSLPLLGVFFLMFALWYLMATSFSDKQGSYWSYLTSTNWFDAIPKTIIPGYLIYLGKIFYPFALSVFPVVDLRDANIFPGIVAFILLVFSFLFFVKEGRKKVFIFGLLWFFILLFPTFINLMPGEPNIIYEHRLYLPIVGLLISFSQIEFVKRSLSNSKVAFFLSLIITLVFFYGNRRHIFNFKDSLSFWESAYSTSSKHFVTEVGLSGVYLSRGDLDKAELVFKKLDEIKPNTIISHLGYASLFYHKGEYEKSLQELDEVLKINPKLPRAMQYIASIKEHQGKYDEAEKYYLEAVEIDDKNVDLLMSLVSFYVKRGKIDKAKEVYKKVQDMGISF